MATRYAAANGNWSALSTWDGGASLPSSSDDVYADGKTVTIDQNVTVNTLRTTQRSGGTTGGGFILNSGCVLTCNGTPGLYCGTVFGYVLTCNYNSPASASVVCTMNATGFPTNDAKAIALSGTGTLNFTGTFVAGNQNTQYGFNITAAATLNITGAITGGGNSTTRNSPVVLCSNAATITIIGNASAGESAAISNSGAATITVTGTVTASAGSPAIANSVSSAVLKVSGPLVNNGKMMAVQSPVLQIGAASTYWQMVDYSNNARNLYTADYLGGNPSVANVRHGTTFGPVGELTGTCYVPGAASVLAGVPVDATVGTVTLTAADIRNAIGLASANLDTQLSSIHAKTTNLPASPAAVGSAMTLTSAYDAAKTASTQASVDAIPTAPLLAANYTAPPTEAEIAAEVFASTVESGHTLKQSLRLILAALAGKLSGAAGTTITIRNAGDTKNRIVATVDADGNRSAVTYDTSD